MKKILSVLLCVSMIISTLALSVVAATDKCVSLTDTSGSTGYSAGNDTVNAKVAAEMGATIIFDVYVDSYSAPTSGNTAQIVCFTGGNNNLAGFDLTRGKFIAGFDSAWVASSGTFTDYATRDYSWKTSTWYELAIQFSGNDMAVYLDGALMVYAETDGFSYEYLILYPQFCNLKIDNLRICAGDYNVADRYGDVWYTDSFASATSSSLSTVWSFSGNGYALSTAGRAMPELDEMLPKRTVAPVIDGAYLKYKEAGGSSIVPTAVDFTPYSGFTYVEDIRFDGTVSGSHFAVRFGANYIAGYDLTNQQFIIAKRVGYSFTTAAADIYATADYAIAKGEVNEIAVRQSGDTVSVFCNGVLMVSATNEAFATGYDTVEISHYRSNVSVDNVVVAYPDYNVREAEGSSVGVLTFDESETFICSIWNYKLGKSGFGYSILNTASAVPALSVGSVTANGTAVTVPVTLKNSLGYTAFILEVEYDSALTANTAYVTTALSGNTVMSSVSTNPITLTYVGSPVPSADIFNIVFTVPEEPGDYTVSATITPYVDDVPAAVLTGTGTVSVPDPGIPQGTPANFYYEDGTFYWDPVDDAMGYDIYFFYDGYENYYDSSDETYYEMTFEYGFDVEGEYYVYIYYYDDSWDYVGRSYPITVFVDSEGGIYVGIGEYAAGYIEKLEAFAASNEYYAEEAREVAALIAEAESAMNSATDTAAVDMIYESYLASIDAVLTKSERTDIAECTPGAASGTAGDTVTVPVTVYNAADVIELSFDVAYDGAVLTYTGYTAIISEDNFSVDVTDNGSAVTVNIVGDDTITGTCDILELIFTVSDTAAEGTTEVTTTVTRAVNASFYEVTVVGGSAQVTVEAPEYQPGDVDGNGVVNSVDVQCLLRLFAGLNVEYNEAAADFNESGSIDSVDLTLLSRFIAGLSV